MLELMLELLGDIGVISMVLTPIIWGIYFYKYRNNFHKKRR